MELDNLLAKKKSDFSDIKQYLALIIGEDFLSTALWQIAGTKPQLVKYGDPKPLSGSLTQAVQTSASPLSQSKNHLPSEVVLSIPPSWVTDHHITASKRTLLKELLSGLSLKAVGFVVTPEAILHHLETIFGQATNHILISLEESELQLTLVTGGQNIGTQNAGRSGDICADVEEALARFDDVEHLPASITLYSISQPLEDLKQELTSCDWQERLNFLHLPKIDALDPQQLMEIIVSVGGQELIKSLEVSGQSVAPIATDVDLDHSPDSNLTQPDSSLPDLQEHFGFTNSIREPDPAIPSQTPADSDAHHPPTPKPPSKLNLTLVKLKNINFPRLSLPKKSLFILLPAVGLLAIFAALFAAYWYIPTASVVVYVNPQTIEGDLEFTADPNISAIDLSTSTVPGRQVQTTVSGSDQTQATGEKLVGEQAKGTVTLFNRTDSVKTFAAGTQLSGPDGLTYTIDEEVTIASASVSEDDALRTISEPAQTSVSITASSIGSEFNLGANTEFSVANFDRSSFIARAQSNIEGGTSRQITSVSQKDRQALSSQLKEKLEQKAQDELRQAPDDLLEVILLPSDEDDFDTNFSKQVGDEAESLDLQATLTVNTITFKKSDFTKLVQDKLQDAIPPNHTLDGDLLESEPATITINSDTSVKINANVKAKIIPRIDPQEVARRIKGRFARVTNSYFTSLPNCIRVEIDINPKLPEKSRIFPRRLDKIDVTIKTSN